MEQYELFVQKDILISFIKILPNINNIIMEIFLINFSLLIVLLIQGMFIHKSDSTKNPDISSTTSGLNSGLGFPSLPGGNGNGKDSDKNKKSSHRRNKASEIPLEFIKDSEGNITEVKKM